MKRFYMSSLLERRRSILIMKLREQPSYRSVPIQLQVDSPLKEEHTEIST
jgi:hypothetical protein